MRATVRGEGRGEGMGELLHRPPLDLLDLLRLLGELRVDHLELQPRRL